MWRRQPATVSRSSSGSSSPASQRATASTPNRSLTGGRPFSRRISTAWISFLARVRARTSWLRRASRRRIARVHSSGIHTASSSPAASSFASVRASSRSVFARARAIPVSCGLTTTTRATCGSRIRAISPALPVTSNATRRSAPDSPRTAQAPPASSRSGQPSATVPPSAIATSQKSRCTSIPIALHTAHLLARRRRGSTGGQTTPTDSRSQRNRASRRGGHLKHRARSPSAVARPAHPAFSQSPCPGHPTLSRSAGQQALRAAVSCPENSAPVDCAGGAVLSVRPQAMTTRLRKASEGGKSAPATLMGQAPIRASTSDMRSSTTRSCGRRSSERPQSGSVIRWIRFGCGSTSAGSPGHGPASHPTSSAFGTGAPKRPSGTARSKSSTFTRSSHTCARSPRPRNTATTRRSRAQGARSGWRAHLAEDRLGRRIAGRFRLFGPRPTH